MPSLRTVTRTPEVSLTLSPMMRSNRDWENWHVGLFPIAVGAIVLVVLLQLDILSWSRRALALAVTTQVSTYAELNERFWLLYVSPVGFWMLTCL